MTEARRNDYGVVTDEVLQDIHKYVLMLFIFRFTHNSISGLSKIVQKMSSLRRQKVLQ